MITNQPDFDLNLLVDFFSESNDYPKEKSLEELLVFQKQPDFLALISEEHGMIDGFLLGCPDGDRLWVFQVWHRPGTSPTAAKQGFEMAKDWARGKGLKSVMCETKRNEMKAFKRFGLTEYKVIMQCRLQYRL